jgi:hypothetical protein
MPNAIFVVNGVKLTTTEAVAVLVSHKASTATVGTTDIAYHAAVAADKALFVQAKDVLAAIEIGSAAAFGVNSTEVATLGFASKKRAAPSAETVAEAVEKAKATRAARGTGGKKQKAKIKGTPAATPDAAKK